MRSIYFRALIISLLFFNSLSFAQIERTAQGRAVVVVQNETHQPSPVQLKAQAELEKKSFALLEEVLADSANLKLPENKLYVNFMLADLLWKKDEKRARELYKYTTRLFADYSKSLNVEDDDYRQIFNQLQQVRQQVLPQLAWHDTQLAQDFLNTSKVRAMNANESRYESSLEVSFANQVSKRDSKEGLRLAKESLVNGLVLGIGQSLHSIQTNDPKGAAELARTILQKSKSENLLDNYDAFSVANNLFNSAYLEYTNRTTNSDPKHIPLLTQSELQELADIIVSNGLNPLPEDFQNPRYSYMANLNSNLTAFESLAPEKLMELKTKTNYKKPTSTYRAELEDERVNQFLEKASVKEILEVAKNSDKAAKNIYTDHAALTAYLAGDTNLAHQILTEIMPNLSERKDRLEDFAQILFTRFLGFNKLDEAYPLIKKLNSLDRKISAIIALSSGYKQAGNKQIARQLLDEAYDLVNKQNGTQDHLRKTFTALSAYLEFDLQAAKRLIPPLNNRIDEIYSASIIMDQFVGNGSSRLSELYFSHNSRGTTLVTEYCSTLLLLAKSDFAHAKLSTEQLQREDLRFLTKFSLVRALLVKYSEQ